MAGLAAVFGSGAMTNSFEEIEKADVILITGTNTTENHPIIAQGIKRAVERGNSRLVVVDPRCILLIIDDEIVVQESCVAIFSEKSDWYDITTVSSGEEALKTLEENYFDIILTDIKMLGLPGLQLLTTIFSLFT